MAKSKKLQSEAGSRCYGASLHKLSSRCKKACGDAHHEMPQLRALEKKEWDNAVCSVCLEFPHNAVLLLCSSFENGCRPYMCATSIRYSNCLEQYSKAYTKVDTNQNTQSWQGLVGNMHLSEEWNCPNVKNEASKLLCPLCRGQVKGWTIVEPARRYLNAKKRACVQDNCSFVGTYKEIRKHVKSEHPKACTWEVDPLRAEKWKKLEREQDLSDVFSTINANTPGAIVLGDYVIEGNYGIPGGYHDDPYFGNALFTFPAHVERWNNALLVRQDEVFDSVEDEYFRRATLSARSSTARNIPGISRPYERFMFARQRRRSRERRR